MRRPFEIDFPYSLEPGKDDFMRYFLDSFKEKTGVSLKHDNGAVIYPREWMDGSTFFEELEEGLFMSMYNIVYSQPFCFNIPANNIRKYFAIFINISRDPVVAETLPGEKQLISARSRNSVHISSSDTNLKITCMAGQHMKGLLIIMSEEWAEKHFGRQPIPVQESSSPYGNPGSIHSFCSQIDIKIMTIINDILSSVNTIPPALLSAYRLGNSLKLITSLYTRILKEPAYDYPQYKLVDVDKLLKLQEKIAKNLIDIPTIAAAAAAVNMSITKFKQLFKQVFGACYGRFWQQHKLTIANEMLKSGKYKVSAVAYELGFSNLGHFSSIYKKSYGVLPKKDAKESFSWDMSLVPCS